MSDREWLTGLTNKINDSKCWASTYWGTANQAVDVIDGGSVSDQVTDLIGLLIEQVEKVRKERDEASGAASLFKAQRDERETAARWLFANLEHAGEADIEVAAELRWSWLILEDE